MEERKREGVRYGRRKAKDGGMDGVERKGRFSVSIEEK